MATQEVKRKLTAIVSADVKSYSRLMGEDKAIHLNPFPPNWYFFSLGNAFLLLGEYNQAAEAYKKHSNAAQTFFWPTLDWPPLLVRQTVQRTLVQQPHRSSGLIPNFPLRFSQGV
jgi:hypothetical protein